MKHKLIPRLELCRMFPTLKGRRFYQVGFGRNNLDIRVKISGLKTMETWDYDWFKNSKKREGVGVNE